MLMLCDCFTLLPLPHSAVQLHFHIFTANWHIWECRSEHAATVHVAKVQSAPQCRWV